MKNIIAALVKAQAEFKPATRNAKANYGKYATLDAILDATVPALNKHGLAISFSESDDGKWMYAYLHHTSGELLESRCRIVGDLNSMQKVGAAHTYSRRYAAQCLLGICADDDDDAQSLEPAKKPAYKPVNQAPQKSGNSYVNISDKQVKRLKAIASKANWKGTDVATYCKEFMGVSVYDMSRDQYQELCDFMEANPIEAE